MRKMRLMSLPAALVLLLFVGALTGCWDRGPSPQEQQLSDLKAVNENLKRDINVLQTQVAEVPAKVRAARLEADQWKVKYEQAAGTAAPRGGTLPPDLQKTFLEIAETGGPWTVGPTGSIKASSDLLFDPGKAELKPGGTDAVKAIAAKLKEILTDERVMLRVDGHTDDVPIRQSEWKDNLHLSMMRARAVVDALIKEGVPGAEMCAAGFGEWHPVAPNDSDAGRTRNRRVELSLISVASPAATPAP
ncbi:MAG TPA: OmpA family protein [Planctomycetota bacterium]|nr:OmpA family protein [Planctomycetota bacterium]